LANPPERIWRLRKRHHQVDALLRVDEEGVEIRFLYDGTLTYSRRWPARAIALAHAAEKREELERSGWTMHW